MKRTHKLKSPIIRRRMDPREPEQITHSRRYIDKWVLHLEAIIASMKSDGLIDMTDPARLGVVSERLIKDMSVNISSEEINHQSKLCGYPENKMLECVLAVLIGKAAIELSTHTSEAHKASMEKALEDAYIFPPPRTTLVVNLADRLSMCLAIKSSISTSFLHTIQTSLVTPVKEEIMNTKPENQQTQTTQAGSGQDAVADNTTSTAAQGSSGSDTQTDKSTDPSASGATSNTESASKKSSTDHTYEHINITTTGVVLSFMVMIFTAGCLLGMLMYFIEVGLAPWLVGLGLGSFATAIIMGIVSMIGAMAISYVAVMLGGMVARFFKKDEDAASPKTPAAATAKTA